eukprot:765230_1
MTQINPISHQPLSKITVKVIRSTDFTDASLNADIASQDTKNKMQQSKRKIQDFRRRTNHRAEKIHSTESKCNQKRQFQIKENLKLSLGKYLPPQHHTELKQSFSRLFKSNPTKTSKQKTTKRRSTLNSRSISSRPWWEYGLVKDNKLGKCEKGQLFLAMRKWNMKQERNNIQT